MRLPSSCWVGVINYNAKRHDFISRFCILGTKLEERVYATLSALGMKCLCVHCRNVHRTGTVIRRSSLALDNVELRPHQHVGWKWTVLPCLDADQWCGGAKSCLQLLLARR